MGFRMGASIVRLHLQLLDVQSVGSESGRQIAGLSSTYGQDGDS
jgi:hypothetical protein